MQNKLKIVHILPFYHPVMGGMEEIVKNIAELQAKAGHDVSIMTSNRDHLKQEIPKSAEKVINGVNIYRFKSYFNLGFISFFPGFALLLRKEQYDIIHIHSYRHPHTEIACHIGKSRGIPTILHGHGPFYSDTISKSKFLLYSLYDFFAKFTVLKKADGLIAFTNLEKEEYYKRGASEEKIFIIRNGIPDKYLEEVLINDIREKYNLMNHKIILCVGRLHPNKRIDHIIKILPDIIRYEKNICLVLAGPGENYFLELEVLACEFGVRDHVMWLGKVSESEKRMLYATADCYIMPSDYEPFGLVLVEAMAHGRPVIAVNNAGPKEIVTNEVTGLLYEQGDLKGLKNAILKILQNPEVGRMLGNNARVRAQNFTLSKMLENINELYRRLIAAQLR